MITVFHDYSVIDFINILLFLIKTSVQLKISTNPLCAIRHWTVLSLPELFRLFRDYSRLYRLSPTI